MNTEKKQLIAKLSPICFFSLVAWGAVSHAAVNPSAGGPSVSAGANGSTIVNINAAGQGGVSHNIYSQFDVDRGGVVLNNSAAGSTSQLAGNIAGNANLAGGSASIILNEVNSTKASQLNGMIDVAGQKAQVIVANPSGISCNGCGFINADRATLTTGKAQVVNGQLLGYTVDKGTIIVNGNGLQTSETNYTDIIARTVQINGNINAKDLKVTVGKNHVNADNTQITELAPASAGYHVGIDVANLGGMYANKITLVSTDNGVGVRNGGTIGASVGDVSITTNGQLVNKGVISAQHDVNIDTLRAKIVNSKTTSGYMLDNSAKGTIKAVNDINIDIGKSRLHNINGTLMADGNINIISGDVYNNSGNIKSQGVVNMRHDPYATENKRVINNNNGVISGYNGVVLSSNDLDNTNGLIQANAGGIDINTVNNTLRNINGTIEACCEINLDVGILYNQSGLIQSLDDVTINTQYNLINNKGTILSKNDMLINSASVTNTDGLIKAANYLEINSAEGIGNSGMGPGPYDKGLFSGKGGMKLSVKGGSIVNNNGRIASEGNIVANSSATMINDNGFIESDKNIVINTQRFQNGNGLIKSANDTEITADMALSNNSNISAEGHATLNLSSSYVHHGKLSGKKGIDINATQGIVYNYGTLSSDNGLTTINSLGFTNFKTGVVDSPDGLNLVLKNPNSFINLGKIDGPISIQ